MAGFFLVELSFSSLMKITDVLLTIWTCTCWMGVVRGGWDNIWKPRLAARNMPQNCNCDSEQLAACEEYAIGRGIKVVPFHRDLLCRIPENNGQYEQLWEKWRLVWERVPASEQQARIHATWRIIYPRGKSASSVETVLVYTVVGYTVPEHLPPWSKRPNSPKLPKIYLIS
ncbi:hypothetical protein C8R45DRAFT_944299 [Mycena sanguinolenta]|nr:hypothetical protein C8R45DRAFT_944299 [Mycena sanguinolenta]